jgi:2-oxoglutarate ferredoxin oxidoreductase subunit alpha
VDTKSFQPYQRNEETLARPWVVPGTKGLEHRIGGLEKQDGSGNVSYDPENHEKMIRIRAEKIKRISQEIPPTKINGPNKGGVLVVGWGSTYGPITSAVEELQAEGKSVSSIHLRFLNPLPKDLGGILQNFKTVLVPEMNLGQLTMILRHEYLVDAKCISKVQGQPFKIQEIKKGVEKYI